MIHITNAAQKYLAKLLNTQKKGTQIRIFIKNLGTSKEECGICYYLPKQNNSSEIIIKFDEFFVYLDKKIKPLIKDTQIDIISNNLGIQIILKSPNINKKNANDPQKKDNNNNYLLRDRIDYVLKYKINPQLATHGGGVHLVNITDDSIAIIQFYGGCNGCAMVSYTIKEGIENTLKHLFPELKGIVDVTQHKHGNHSYL